MSGEINISEIKDRSMRRTGELQRTEEQERRVALSRMAAGFAAGGECDLDSFIFLVTEGQHNNPYYETTVRLSRLKFVKPGSLVAIFKDRTVARNRNISMPMDKILKSIGIVGRNPSVSFSAEGHSQPSGDDISAIRGHYNYNAYIHYSKGVEITERWRSPHADILTGDQLKVPVIEPNATTFRHFEIDRTPKDELAVASIAVGAEAIFKELEDIEDERALLTIGEFINKVVAERI